MYYILLFYRYVTLCGNLLSLQFLANKYIYQKWIICASGIFFHSATFVMFLKVALAWIPVNIFRKPCRCLYSWLMTTLPFKYKLLWLVNSYADSAEVYSGEKWLEQLNSRSLSDSRCWRHMHCGTEGEANFHCLGWGNWAFLPFHSLCCWKRLTTDVKGIREFWNNGPWNQIT